MIIFLNNLELKTFTEQDALDYCQINNIDPLNITELLLGDNKLTDISGIKIFKNLENLSIKENLIKNISDIKYLNNLETLQINGLELESDQFKYIQSLNNLKILFCKNGFKDMNILKQLDIFIKVYK